MDDLAALRLQIEWGADEALLDAPVDRFVAAPAPGLRAPPDRAQAPRKPVPPRMPALAPLTAVPALAAEAAAAATDLAALHVAMDGFDACALRGTASHTVRPSGDPQAGLVLLAETPGPEDDRSGEAFSAAPGQMLDRVLGSAGLDRGALLLAFVVPWRPPGGRPPNEAEIAACLPFLHRLLVLSRTRRLVLMGGGPLRALLPESGTLRQARGRWAEVPIPGLDASLPALPMLPPDLWLKTASNRQAVWADLLTLRQRLAG